LGPAAAHARGWVWWVTGAFLAMLGLVRLGPVTLGLVTLGPVKIRRDAEAKLRRGNRSEDGLNRPALYSVWLTEAYEDVLPFPKPFRKLSSVVPITIL
jgi:hypothetical protein